MFEKKRAEPPLSSIPSMIRDDPWPPEQRPPLERFAKPQKPDAQYNEPVAEPEFNGLPIDLKSLEDAMTKSPLAEIAEKFLALKYGDMIELARGMGTVTGAGSLPDPTTFAPILHLWAERFKNNQIPEKQPDADNGPTPVTEKPKNGRKPRPTNDDTKALAPREETGETGS